MRRIGLAWLAGVAWAVAGSLAAWQAVAWLLPQELLRGGHVYLFLAGAAFFGHVLAFHIGLLAAGTLLLAAGLRRWRLAAVAGAVVAATLVPAAWDARPRTPPPGVGEPLRLMSINLWFLNDDAGAVLAEIRRQDPEVLVMLEMASPVRSALKNELPQYPHRVDFFYRGHAAVYSKRPLRRGKPAADFGIMDGRAAVHFDWAGREIALFGVHLVSPSRAGMIRGNRRETAELAEAVYAERTAGRLVVVAGDHNFTTNTANAAALYRAGLTTSFDLAGGGRDATWPARPTWRAALPGVRIDHVWLDPALTATSHEIGDPAGSDHRPVITDVRLRAAGKQRRRRADLPRRHL